MTTILVDMDGVLVDWGDGYGRALDSYGDDAKKIARHAEQTTFDLRAGLSYTDALLVDKIMNELDYFDMRPIEGGRDALNDMKTWGYNVFICTAPWVGNTKCVGDKLRWVDKHLGPEWVRKTIITADKTIVRGDFLIDDKPVITGSKTPLWKQILFTQPYNLEVPGFRLNSWDDWDNEDWA